MVKKSHKTAPVYRDHFNEAKETEHFLGLKAVS